eukprot:EG_transcript_50064
MVLRENSVHTRTEVAFGGKKRPADVALDGVDHVGPLAVDLVVFHPLRKGLSWEEDLAVKNMAMAEHKKITKNQPIIESAGWLISPLSFHPGPGLGLLGRLVKQAPGDKKDGARQHLAQEIW